MVHFLFQTDKLVYDLTDGSPESFVVNTDHSNIRNSSESSHGIVVDRQIVYSVIRVFCFYLTSIILVYFNEPALLKGSST